MNALVTEINILTALVLAAWLSGCSAFKPYCSPDESPREGFVSRSALAYELILGANEVQSTYMRESGTPSCYVWALQILVDHPRGVQMLKELTDKATLAGQLYALGGLYFVDKDEYRARLPRYLNDQKGKVWVIETCFSSIETVATVAADIESGEWPDWWAERIEH